MQAVISAVIGFPAEDTARIQAWTDDVNMLWNMLAPVGARIASARRMADYTRYLQALIDDRRAHPREDLISDLVHGRQRLSRGPRRVRAQHDPRRGPVAGFDTTRDAITATVLIMLENPGVRERVLADPARVDPQAHRGGAAPGRAAPGPVPRSPPARWNWAARRCPPGRRCCCCSGRVTGTRPFSPDPDDADLDRPNVRDHLAFGRGLHSCPGAPMARAEIRVALETLIRRLPGLRLADGYQPTYIASYFFRGLESLDVTW